MRYAYLIGLLWAGTAPAQDYAWYWPLQVPEPGQPVYRVVLSEDVYAATRDPLMRDVDVQSAAGQRIATTLDSERVHRYTRSERVAVPWFPLSSEQARSAGSLRAVLQGDTVSIEASPGAAVAGRGAALLIDLGEQPGAARGLHVQLVDSDASWSVRFAVETSADLSQWRALRPPAQLHQLQHQGQRLQQLALSWSAAPARYLRLTAQDASGDHGFAATRIAGIEAERHPQEVAESPELHWLELTAQPGSAPGEWIYQTPGPLPVRQWRPLLDGRGWLLATRLASRSAADRDWVDRGQHIAYRIDLDGETLQAEPARISPTRDRGWRLILDDANAAPPRLQLGYLPDQLLFAGDAADGYRLVAGSSQARRLDAPMAALLAAVRERRGADWLPPQASLGTRQELAGVAALDTSGSDRWGKWLLWGVLIAVALTLARFALRLMRPPT